MKKGRLESFSDAVIAIVITIMVLELKVPEGNSLDSLLPVIPTFFSYLLSFIYLAIYWNNHHHMMYTVKFISGDILWANLHLLFWLSLVPFVSGWLGENHLESVPVALYGVILLMASIAYWILQYRILVRHGSDSILAKAIGRDLKGKSSILLYLFAVIFSFIIPWVSAGIYVFVALMWLVPDKRIEIILKHQQTE